HSRRLPEGRGTWRCRVSSHPLRQMKKALTEGLFIWPWWDSEPTSKWVRHIGRTADVHSRRLPEGRGTWRCRVSSHPLRQMKKALTEGLFIWPWVGQRTHRPRGTDPPKSLYAAHLSSEPLQLSGVQLQAFTHTAPGSTLAVVKRFATLLSTAVAVLAAATSVSADPNDLPDMGSPAEATLSLQDEYQIGRMIVRGLRDSDRILEDPEVTEYIQSLGARLSSHANDGSQKFTFFMAKENSINAFALPGGFIGVNAGLVLETKNESELAGVVAHEIAHVTQRHIARSIAAQSKNSLVSTAAMLAAILIGAAGGGGGDMAMAGVAAAQSLAIQQQISFTRSNESEADRVGLGILANAGFDPHGMPAFFETMSRHAGGRDINIPEMLRTHPVSSARIAETKERALQLSVDPQPESISYALMKERLRVLSTPPGEDPRQYYSAVIGNEPDATTAQIYGR